MSTGQGWWINPEGKFYSVLDHYNFIKENPQLFGFTKEQVLDFKIEDRERVLMDVMKDGWIRVRDWGGGRGVSFETWELTPKIRNNMLDFLYDELGYLPETKFHLSELSRRFYGWTTPGDIKRGSIYYLVAFLIRDIASFFNIFAIRVSRRRVLAPIQEGSDYFFMIHDHKATRRHWDLRIEWPVQEGIDINEELEKEWSGKAVDKEDIKTRHKKTVLRSWALPKHRLPITVGERLMAAETELHPYEYKDFEGEIEEGKYGAGDVKIFDKGTATILKFDPKSNVIVMHLKGKKIDDVISMVPAFKNTNQWLIIKVDKRKWLNEKKKAYNENIYNIAIYRDWTLESLSKLSVEELTFDHALTHRGVNAIRSGEGFGEWTIKELKELHNALVDEARKRGLDWGVDHKTPI